MRCSRALALFLSFAAFVCAQNERASITGTVTDPAGAVVDGAPIQARNTETGAVYDTASTNTGNYTLAQLPVATYELTITVPGFKRYTRSGLTLQVAQVARVDVTLEVGAATESVTVNEAAPLLKTESGELSHNVSTDSMNSLPILGIGSSMAGSSSIRNPQTALLLVPGAYVVPNAQVRVNGAPGNTASYRVEGQDATNGMQISQAQVQPSVDSIQEVTVQTSNFAAEYGQVGGGFLNYAMKSGTNQLHGTAYDYFVNEVFNSNTPWVNSKPRARRHDYGFTLGGPVVLPKIYNGHDKTFFFFNWEQFRESQYINSQVITVTAVPYRSGNFARALTGRNLGTDPLGRQIPEGGIYDPNTQRAAPNGNIIRDQFPGNTIPLARQDPVALKIQGMIPLPNLNDNLINNAIYPYPAARVTQIPSFKIDHSLSTRAKLSYYWHQTKTAAKYSPLLSGSDGLPEPITSAMGTYITAYTQRANFEYTIRPTVLFHGGIGYLTDFFRDDPVVTNFNPLQTLGLKGVPVNRLFPLIQGLQATGTGGMKVMGTSQNRSPLLLQKPTANTSLTWVKGNHTYKFGGELRISGPMSTLYTYSGSRFQFSANETALPYLQTTNVGGGTVGFPYASFMLGRVNQLNVSDVMNMRMGQNATGLFAQDTWKVTRRLTLDYGLRYDYQTYPRQSTASPFAQFAPNVPNPSAGGQPGAVQFDGYGPGRCNCNLANNYPLAFAPRLGVAYQLNPKTVLRGGFGIVYAAVSDAYGVTQGAYSIPAAVASPGFSEPVMILGDGIPFPPQRFPNFSVGQYPQDPRFLTTQAPPYWIDQNAGRPARQVQWSISVQRELARDLVFEASYVGNRGVWWNAPHFSNPNALTEDLLAKRGLSLNNAADVTLLRSALNSATAVQRGFNKAPFTGFPVTATVAQSLRPFPQFSNIIASWAPNGNTWYDSMQLKATKRYSYGLQFSWLLTWSKQLTTAAPSLVYNASTVGDGGAARNDVFNRKQNKYLSSFDQPLQMNLAATYTLPALRINKIASWAIRDWQINTLLVYASGMPIQAPAAQNNLDLQLFRSTFANRVPGVPLFTQDLNCHCFDPNKEFVLNPAAWTQPAAGQWGTSAAFYSDYRYQRRPNENMALGRMFRFSEKMSLNLRIEFNNIFNRAQMPNPTVTNSSATQTRTAAGVPTGGFGFINAASVGPVIGQIPTSRQGSVVARFVF
jgi:hypothetical protein